MIGSVAGSYRIIDVLSVGGMGTVYRAEHTLIGRAAAVKVLHPEMSASKDIVNRFFNEARATTSIKHPGIVEVYDFGYLESGHAYLVMEFLEGRTLAARNKSRGAIPEGEAAMVLRGVLGALAAAHAKGIVHRDLKPDNIFLVPDPDSQLGERAKILDFGIAKLTDVGLATGATKTGAVMGTPTYMSPEQCKGTGEVDHRADLYSIGCIFYEMVTGRPPFNAHGAGELIGAHLFMQPESPRLHAPGLTPEAEGLIMALLAKNPAERPQTAVDLANVLGQLASREGWASATAWERPSMAGIGPDGRPSSASFGSHTGPGHTPLPTPSFGRPTPVPHAPTPTPSHASMPGGRMSGMALPIPAPPPTPMPTPGQLAMIPTPGPALPTPIHPSAPTIAEKPTTLSGAATQAPRAPMPGRSSKRIIAAIAGTAVVGGAIALVLAFGGADDKAADPGVQPTKAAAGSSAIAGTPAPPTPTSPTSPTSGSASTPTPSGTPAPAGSAAGSEAGSAAPSGSSAPAAAGSTSGSGSAGSAADTPSGDKPAGGTPAGDSPSADTPAGDKPKPERPRPRPPRPRPKPGGSDPLLETDL